MIVGVATARARYTPGPRATRDLRRELAHVATDDAIDRHLRDLDLYVRPGTWAARLIGEAS
ncbi:hypothetical protein ACFRCG_41635 [Embleya sp. NPDC056575]|uniref:hypothetical protein n=1 Tax=unclassified Embleya TaxID=2699296 RepID=UPI0036C761D8